MVEDIKFKVKQLEKKYNMNYYELLQRYMFERILERISISKYQDNFILKGGLLLSAMFGVNNRTTKDMDTTIKGIDISKESIIKILNEILCIKLNDNVKFDIVDITDIRETDKYGGNKYHIVGIKDNTKVNLEIDISTGDEITPKEIKFKYPLLFEDRSILVNSYNAETILSEKVETVLRRGKYNSRMKDFYDIYLFITEFKNDINLKILKKSIITTFRRRKSLDYLDDYKTIINTIVDSDRMKKLWLSYCRKNEYVDTIEFRDVLYLLRDFLDKLQLDIVFV